MLIRILFVLSLLYTTSFAAIEMPAIFGDHMVLQRDQAVPVWGKADPGQEITVTFAGQSKTTKANEDGNWRVNLDAMKANSVPGTFTINDRVFNNVLVGEVWICSGQSNMEWGVNGSKQPDIEKASADFPLIRHIKLPHRPSDQPEFTFKGQWTVCSKDSVSRFTGVGYFFGREIHTRVDVPVGLINTSWGGTKIEPWTPLVGFNRIKDQPFTHNILKKLEEADPTTETGKKRYTEGIEKMRAWLVQAEKDVAVGIIPQPLPRMPTLNRSHQDPTRLYKGMIHPLIPYAIRGAIWYQGESNGGEGESYTHKMDALINGWRQVWQQGDFPFYYVQLANFHKDNNQPAGGDGFAKVRNAQTAALKLKNTGMAVIIDIGEANDIHPRNKQDVGKRLAQWALKNDYGHDVLPSGPKYKSHQVQDGEIHIQFDYVGKGLIVGEKNELDPVKEKSDGQLRRFAIAGNDKNWVWADAKIDGDSVIVSSEKVDNPEHVRYAYSANPEGANLYNRDGLPAIPFRTDED